MGQSKISRGLGAALLVTLAASSAHAAGAARTWVSGVGDDTFPCSRTAPCKTFASAISKTADGGEISVLDPGAYGTVLITKSITINGTPGAGYGSMLAQQGINGIIINMNAADPYKTVRLNWLEINGVSTGLHGIRIVNTATTGVSVVIENTNIDGFTGSGILDERSMPGKLTIANTVVRHTLQSGIKIAAGGGAGSKTQAVLSNVRVHNSAQAALTVNGGAKAMVSNSVFSGSAFGVDVEQANSDVTVSNSMIAGNTTGLLTTGGAVLRLSNSDVILNGTGVNGTVESYSNNRFNPAPGGTITAIGQPGSATGLQ